MRRTTPRKVAILCPTSIPWISLCIDGIRQFAREQGGWHLFSSPPSMRGTGESALTIRSMRGWKGDAVIMISDEPHELRYARGFGLPMVNLGGGAPKAHGVPRVMVNHFKAGRMAADHLLARGLRNLAFFGWQDLWYSEQRQLGFMQRTSEAGAECKVLLRASRHESNQNWAHRVASLTRWLVSLPRPCGIFAVHDYRAQFLIEACQEAGLRIPADIAVVGMDNNEAICEHVVPTLSSISRGSQRVGWEAASLLDKLMRGEKPPLDDYFLDPDGVVARGSTAMQYCEDPMVQAALDFMRDNLEKQFNVSAVADHTATSKRTLEMAFRQSLGTSPHRFLTKLRVQRAEAMLRLPQKRSIEDIASECGFGTAATFYAAFRRMSGQSPANFRRESIVSLKDGRGATR
ncbi:MAG TPA: substrate-binding domain-containing protein [Opitutaceae bacterium]|nr:substrate-binding domain-containing protein [Opitutaceae bacterium]